MEPRQSFLDVEGSLARNVHTLLTFVAGWPSIVPKAGVGDADSGRKEAWVRIANVDGRLALITQDGALDVEQASAGRFESDPQAVYARWDEFRDWAATAPRPSGAAFDPEDLGPPVPRPSQVFAIGLNYREHAQESGYQPPTAYPPVFTKFPSCVAGPNQTVVLPEGNVDWELELVVVIGRPAWRISADDAWDHIAGLTVGQDISERVLQFAMTPPQFSMAKSFPGFGPIGPVLVSPDEFADPNDLELTCTLNGDVVQSGRTSQMIFPVAHLVAMLSSVTPLRPGDLVFTGTPRGVGLGRTPPLFITAGDELVSSIESIGTMTNRFTR